MSDPRKGRPQPRGSDRVRWAPLVDHAASIVSTEQYGMTLRGLFYRLVAEHRLRNSRSHYQTLSRETAKARREGRFPALIDRGRFVRRPGSHASPEQALAWLRDSYRRDRTETQPLAIYVGVEKNTLVGPLTNWLDEYGLPVLALGGYSSQTFVDLVAEEIVQDGRESVLIYAGDLDPSGEQIDRDFVARTGVFHRVERVALTVEQVETYGLPPAIGKASDPRAADFIARHGRLIQVELEALPLAELRRLYDDAIARLFDVTMFDAARAQEDEDRARLDEIIGRAG